MKIEIEIADDDVAALARGGTDPAAVAKTAVHRAAEVRREDEAYQEASLDGRLFTAKWIRHGAEEEKRFLTPQQAANYLEWGEEEGTFSSYGVYAPDGTRIWKYLDGWSAGWPRSS